MAVSTKGVASRCDFVLLLGDSFFYPAVVLTTAILASWIMNCSQPTGLLSTANLSLAVTFSCDGLPFLGAALGRWIVSTTSRTMFLVLQFAVVAVGWVLLEVAMRYNPNVFKTEEEVVGPAELGAGDAVIAKAG